MTRLACLIVTLCSLAGCAEGPSSDSPSPASTPTGATISTAAKAGEGDWPYWRGPSFNGIADDGPAPPVRWSETQSVVWKAELPGRGHSSPTILGGRIYLATADEGRQVQSVLALERETGKQVWKQDVSRGGFPRRIHRKNTHATCTVATDGERLFVAFYNHNSIQVTSLDLDGKELWQHVAGPFDPKSYQYGYAPSPTIYKSLVIYAADYDGGGYLVAYDRESGKQAWKTNRPARLSYSSPVVANVAGRDQLLISGCDRVSAFNPADGKELWSTDATTMATCGTMVWDGDLVFASGGYPKAQTVCIRGDGSGKIVWQNNQKCYEQSMLAHDGYVYALTDGGIAYCWKGSTGEQMWRSRLRGPVSASPVLAGGNIYATNERGTTYVFKATPQRFESVSQNQLGDESFASLAICGGRVYARVAKQTGGRRQEFLYCLGR